MFARTTDPATSHMAVPADTTAQLAAILAVYLDGDYTIMQADDILGVDAHRRQSEGIARGFLSWTGEMRVNKTGAKARVLTLTSAGRAFLGMQSVEIAA